MGEMTLYFQYVQDDATLVRVGVAPGARSIGEEIDSVLRDAAGPRAPIDWRALCQARDLTDDRRVHWTPGGHAALVGPHVAAATRRRIEWMGCVEFGAQRPLGKGRVSWSRIGGRLVDISGGSCAPDGDIELTVHHVAADLDVRADEWLASALPSLRWWEAP